MENDSASSVDALSAIRQGHERAIAYARSPWWYYPALGIGYAILGIAFSLGGSIIRTLALIAFLAAGKLTQRGFRRANGVWVGGLRSGVASWWSVGFLLVSLGTIVAGWLIGESLGTVWPVVIMAVLILVETLLYGFFFDRAVQRKRRPALS
ncbi:hypothetical protein IV500_20845 [Paeniglutamicibacter antarcticus]|uniref:Transmembrane protein n=1 Tax=Arthrobacter terrae TaxID=2935737 RepID=A0A931CVP8_9MICC|nr:hypothetical protein [Arthrobacter terrae]MBG0741804.1 hypothetical protein [Arthrobacter terrae]